MRPGRVLILFFAALYAAVMLDTFSFHRMGVPTTPVSVCYDDVDDTYMSCRDMWWVEQDI